MSLQRPALSRFGLDGRLLAVLTLVEADGPALQQRLCERLGVDRTTMVALIDTLEQKRLVERQRDPLDRRGYRVHLTAKGAGVVARAVDAIDAVEHDFLDGLSREEQRQFRTLLGRVVVHGGPGVASSPLTQE